MIKVIAIGKIKEKSLQQLLGEYLKRLSSFTKIEIIELAESKIKDDSSDKMIDIIKQEEGSSILRQVNEQDYLWLLDLRGESYTSERFSKQIEHILATTRKDLVFVIGGSHGVSDEVSKRANGMICFSHMTFPHQLIRLFLLEQIYRGFMIKEGRSYHK